MQAWSEKEDVFLSRNYRIKSVQEIAKELNRSVSAIRERARRLGVSRMNELRIKTGASGDNIEKKITASGGLIYKVGNITSHRMTG